MERSEPERASGGSFLAGAGQTLAIVAGFVAVGLLAGELAAGGRPGPPGARAELSYIRGMVDEKPQPAPRVWLVDGFNALHVAVLRGRPRAGWWTREGRELLLARVRGFEDRSAEVWVVFDGPHPLAGAEGEASAEGPRVAFAASADAWLLQRVRGAQPGEVAVVTADRPLAARARARGARVVSPRDFLARCAAPSRDEP
jgi:hypothetical protein